MGYAAERAEQFAPGPRCLIELARMHMQPESVDEVLRSYTRLGFRRRLDPLMSDRSVSRPPSGSRAGSVSSLVTVSSMRRRAINTPTGSSGLPLPPTGQSHAHATFDCAVPSTAGRVAVVARSAPDNTPSPPPTPYPTTCAKPSPKSPLALELYHADEPPPPLDTAVVYTLSFGTRSPAV